jgi:hypothetical protein
MRFPFASSTLFNKGLMGAAFLATAATVQLLAPTPAQASSSFVVTVGPDQWDVTTVTGAFGNGTNVGGVNLTTAPWWEDQNKAIAFTDAVGAQLGYPNLLGLTGPFFGYRLGVKDEVLFSSQSINGDILVGNQASTSIQVSRTWATATRVPGPLPILGAAAAFGFSRKLRKRIKSSTNAVSSTPGA